MVAFLKSINNKSWKDFLKGWNHHVVKDKDRNESLNPEEYWSKEEDEIALGNSKAQNAIFNGIDKNIFRLVNSCEVAKDA